MKIAYFDCFSGVAGDMMIGALLDAGLSLELFKNEMDRLGLTGYAVTAQKVSLNGISATRFGVKVLTRQPSRNLKDIRRLITSSALEQEVKEKSVAVFQRLAEAEGRVHGKPAEEVHFHEVGAVDAIVDVCGAIIGLESLGIGKIFTSNLPLGKGSVETSHGIMPIPAPATVELTKGYSVELTDRPFELTTPTGAAILTTIAEFSNPGLFELQSVGYGAGSKEFPGMPNLLRVMIGNTSVEFDSDVVTTLETNLDRATPEMLGELLRGLLEAAALEAYITPIIMKKGRPGHLLTVLCSDEEKERLVRIIFSRGVTLGIRVGRMDRIKLLRSEVAVATSGGNVRVKVADCQGLEIVFPEFDDMTAAMSKSGRTYEEIYIEVRNGLKKET